MKGLLTILVASVLAASQISSPFVGSSTETLLKAQSNPAPRALLEEKRPEPQLDEGTSPQVISVRENSYVSKRIDYYSGLYGVDSFLAKEIVRCESGFNQFADNPSSTAQGYFQFLDSTWETTMERMGYPTSTSKFDPELSIEAGVFLLAVDGNRHWEESALCWGK